MPIGRRQWRSWGSRHPDRSNKMRPTRFFGGSGGRMGRESKMLCNEVTNAYTTWQSLQQKFVAIHYLWLSGGDFF